MILITGGAYQSKRRFAAERFALAPEDICDCARSAPDLSKRALCHVEQYVLRCVREGRDETALLREPALAEKILIFDDISCGVVPLEAELRQWRNVTGQLCQYLSKNAQRVSRVFCGLEQRLK